MEYLIIIISAIFVNNILLYQALGIFLPLITTNCAVLGVAISVIDKGFYVLV